MPTKDQPPQHIWLDDEAITEHFDRVLERSANPDATADDEPLSQNELTKGLRSG